MSYSQVERLNIVIDIMSKLKNFKLSDGETIDLYSKNYSFIQELKDISNKYIKEGKTIKGYLIFEEIGKKIEYHFPEKTYKKPLFVIRSNGNLKF